jgi:hypothetical protein
MPLSTDLSVSPYQDDFNPDKNFHRVLFKPATPVQVRELNQLQTILQNQIERFGNNIYKRGTIIDGVNFQTFPDYAYVKINDNQVDGAAAFPALYVGHFAKDPSTNLVAQVINSADGFEATDPNLKTLYLRYINSGVSGNAASFSSNSILTIYDYDNSVQTIDVNNGSSGFSNADSIVLVSAIAVNVTSANSFANGEYLVQTGVRAIITNIDNASYPGKTILSIKPAAADLANTAANSSVWTFPVGSSVTGNTTSASATVTEIIGVNAAGTLVSDGDTGKVIKATITNRGSGYYVPPYATIKSAGKTTPDYTDLDISAKNYIGQVKVANTAQAIGAGYAFGVSAGIIYQKGFFVRVTPQVAIVSKYNPLPDSLSVGFVTQEAIIDSNIDTSLLDNSISGALGRPGADRLNLIPQLTVVSTNSVYSNSEFLSLADFSAGQMYRLNDDTQFNSVETEMATRMKDTSGNFVIDTFQVTTRSSYDQTTEGSKFAVITDPGRAYINGKLIDTMANFVITNDKGVDYLTTNNVSLSIDYGNYILINQMGGTFQFTTADTVDLYDTATGFLSNTAAVVAGNTSPAGNKIGTARIRSLVYDSETIGTPQAVYRLHVFDIHMLAGNNFKNTKTVYYNGAQKGVADAIQTVASSVANSANATNIVEGANKLVFPIVNGVKNVTGIQYTYRTMTTGVNLANTGSFTISLAANTNQFFSYNYPVFGQLNNIQLTDLFVIPTSNNIIVAPNANGTIAVTSGSNTVVGTGTSFTQVFNVGDYLYAYGNTTAQSIARITGIANNTQLSVDTNISFTNAVSTFTKIFPKNVRVPLNKISGANVSVDGTGDVLTINIGSTVNTSGPVTVSVAYDVLNVNVTPQAKVANRSLVAKIQVANNAGGLAGPWCLGVPDIFRLRKVYLGANSSVDSTAQDVTSEFYIDHNQNANFLDLGYLYKNPKSSLPLTSGAFLLAVFDAYTSSPGVYTLTSYVSANLANRLTTDSLSLGAIGTNVNSFEVPEVYTSKGDYYDLLDCIDFRPVAANTITLTTVASSASINPSSTLSFGNTADPSNDRKFPLPQTSVLLNVDQFMGRKDLVIVTDDSSISLLKGIPSPNGNYVAKAPPSNALMLNTLSIPPYPNLAKTLSANTSAIIHTGIANERFSYTRVTNRTINTGFTQTEILKNQPINYTMSDIGNLERRITDLESQVALNTLETSAKDLVIPSSVDPSISRFKYGFYVDNFDNGQFSDLKNPEFHAEFMSGKVVPPSSVTLVCHGDDTYITNPAAREYTLINQGDATVGTNTVASSNTGVITHILERREANDTVLGGPILTGPSYPDTVSIKMSSSVNGVQSCTLYLYNYSAGDRISIYKGTAPSNTVFTSTLDAVALTQSDIDYLKTQPFFASVSANLKTTLQTRTQLHAYQAGWLVLYGAKIVFQHNPADGSDYTIVTEKGPQSAFWRWQLNYPVDAAVGSPSNVPAPVPAVGPDPAIYTEFPYTRVFFDPTAPITQPEIVNPVMNGPTLYAAVCTISGVFGRSAGVNVTARGLMPSTVHRLYVDPTGIGGANVSNLDLTSHCSSVTNPNNPLLSDSSGTLTFTISPTVVNAAWGQPSAADAQLFDKLTAMSYPGLNQIPLLLNGGQNLGVGSPGYIFGQSFSYFSLPWLDYSQYTASYVDTSSPPTAAVSENTSTASYFTPPAAVTTTPSSTAPTVAATTPASSTTTAPPTTPRLVSIGEFPPSYAWNNQIP